jgi:CBS domain-containing protein
VVAPGLNPLEVGVQDFISPNPVTVSPDDDVEEARQLMSDRQIRRVLVTEDEKLVGILSIGDMAIKDKSADDETGQVLEDISQPTDLNRVQ